MAIESIKYAAPETETAVKTKAFPRPGQHTTGIIDWLTTIDHKKIGFLYGLTALFFLLLGGLEALLIRSQLWDHNMSVLTNRQYNQMFTMHGTTMVFYSRWNYPQPELVFYRWFSCHWLVWLCTAYRYPICRSNW